MKSYGFLLTGIILLLSACTKDDDTPGINSTSSALDYIPLQVGNYWIYDWYSFLAPGEGETFFLRDTLTVRGTEEIDGKEFFRLERANSLATQEVVYWRDSLGYLVDEKGTIYFAPTKPGAVFNTRELSYLNVESSVAGDTLGITVPAGDFPCVIKENAFLFIEEEQMDKNKSGYDYISLGVGEVKGTRPFADHPNYYEYRLVEFFLK